jgi:hypothetical protein
MFCTSSGLRRRSDSKHLGTVLLIFNHTLHSKGLARLPTGGGAGNNPNVNAIFTTDFIRIKKYSYFFLRAPDAGREPL